MVIRFNQLGSGVGGVLINDRWGLVGVVYVPGALQEKLEPMQDDPEIHPPKFCQSCYCSMKRCSNAAKDGVSIRSSTIVYEWKKHGQHCSVRFKKQHR